MTKTRILLVSFAAIVATVAATVAVYLALNTPSDPAATNVWFGLWCVVAFYGVLIGLVWWAYPTIRSRAEQRSRSYVLRHWRGESGLGVSWWANGALVGAVVAVGWMILNGLDMARHPTATALSYVGMTVLAIILTVWHWGGVWRSTRHARSAFWGITARVLTIMAYGALIANAARYSLPSATEMLRIAMGTDEVPRHHLRILNGGKEIELAGGIDFGTAADFKVLVDATPTVTTVDLNNTGGRIAEAEKLRDILLAHHLSTYTSALCASACTVVFMAGRQRYLGPKGKLGFHRWSFPGLPPNEDAALNAAAERAMVAVGVTPAFAARVFSTAASDLWVPDTAALLAAHVVTRLTNGNDFSATAGDTTVYTTEAVDRLLASANPALAALKRWEPARYAEIVRDFLAGLQQGGTVNDLITAADPPLERVIAKYRKIADDGVQVQIAQTLVRNARSLRDHPSECTAMLKGTSSAYAALLPEDIGHQNIALSARIIESGASDPSYVVLSKPAFDASVEQTWRTVFSAYPSVRAGYEATADQSVQCTGLAAFYETIARLPPAQAGAFLRQLWRQ